MSRRSGLRDTNLKLKAGSDETLSLQGNYLRISSATSDVVVEIEGTDVFKLSPGEDVVYPVGEEFSRVVLRTLAAVEDSVTVTIGKNVTVGSAKVSGAVSITGVPAVTVSGNLTGIQNDVAIKTRDFNVSRYFDLTGKAALSVTTLLTPAENVNGFDLREIMGTIVPGGAGSYADCQIVASAGVPAGIQSNGVIAVNTSKDQGSEIYGDIVLKDLRIPAGVGVFLITRFALSATVGYNSLCLVGKLL